jgi:hypothetical protein
MGFRLFDDKIGALTQANGVITLAPSLLTIGGQQYRTTTSLSVTPANIVAASTYMIYAVVTNNVVSLVTSTNANSVGPGTSAWKLVGAFLAFTNAFGAFVTIRGVPKSQLTSAPVPTITATGSAPLRPTTGVTETLRVAQDGDHMHYVWNYAGTVTTGTNPGSGDYQWALPAFQFDPNKATFTTTVYQNNAPIFTGGLGAVTVSDGTSFGAGEIYPYDATRFRIAVNFNKLNQAGGIFTFSSSNFYFGQSAVQRHSIDAMIPILGWSTTPLEDL